MKDGYVAYFDCAALRMEWDRDKLGTWIGLLIIILDLISSVMR